MATPKIDGPANRRGGNDGTAEADRRTLLERIAPLVPYVAVLVGLYVAGSAWLSILLYHAGILTILAIAGRWRFVHTPDGVLGAWPVTVVIVGSALVGPLVYAVWDVVKLDSVVLESELADLGLSGGVWLAFMIYYFTVNPLLEELFWRGYLGSRSPRLAVNDVWFGGYHILVLGLLVKVPAVGAAFAGLVGAGWLWRQIARRNGSLTVPIASHAVADASLIVSAFLLAS